jgi:hypothetical protein
MNARHHKNRLILVQSKPQWFLARGRIRLLLEFGKGGRGHGASAGPATNTASAAASFSLNVNKPIVSSSCSKKSSQRSFRTIAVIPFAKSCAIASPMREALRCWRKAPLT